MVRAPKPSYAYKTWRLEDCCDDDEDHHEAWDAHIVQKPGDATSRRRLKSARELSTCKVAYSHPAWPLMSEVEQLPGEPASFRHDPYPPAADIMPIEDIQAKFDEFVESRDSRPSTAGSIARYEPKHRVSNAQRGPVRRGAGGTVPVTQRYHGEVRRLNK